MYGPDILSGFRMIGMSTRVAKKDQSSRMEGEPGVKFGFSSRNV